MFLDLLSVQRVNKIKLYKKDPNTVTGLLRKQTRDNAGENTIKASVSIETGHCGHIEDLLKSLLGSIIPCALRQTVPTLQEQQTTPNLREGIIHSLTLAGGFWSRHNANDRSAEPPQRSYYKVTDADSQIEPATALMAVGWGL